MKFKLKHLRFLGPVLIFLVFAAAAWFLYGVLKKHSFVDIRESIRQISTGRLIAAIALTVLSYIILVGYDLLAVRFVGERLSLWKVALASFTGYAFSYNFGATLTGGPIRFRLYSAWGVPLGKLAQLLVILGLTLWFGLFALAGTVFTVAPLSLPKSFPEPIPPDFHLPGVTTRPLGIVLLVIAAIYVGLSAMHRGSIQLFRWRLPVPPFKLTLYQVAVASADFLVATAVLYSLFPTIPGVNFEQVLGIYMVAYVIEVLTHVPGGWGVREAVALAFIAERANQSQEAGVIAALLLFRVVYNFIPLVFATLLLCGHEVALHAADFDAT